MLRAELRVGMMEAQERGAGYLRSGIHLRSPRRSLTNNEPDFTGSVQVPQALRWLHCSDNPLNRCVIDFQPFDLISNESVIVPNRDDQRNKQTVGRVHSSTIRKISGMFPEKSDQRERTCLQAIRRGVVVNSKANCYDAAADNDPVYFRESRPERRLKD